MRKLYFILIQVFVFTLQTYSQNAYDPEINSYNKIGITTKIIDKLPIELSFIHLKDSGFSYLLNFGYSGFNVVGTSIVFAEDIRYPYHLRVLNYHANSMFLKYGVVLFHTTGYLQRANFYSSINVIGSIADYSMDIQYGDDIYGDFTRNYNEIKFNIASESESGVLVNLGKSKRFVFNIGFTLGLKIINQKPFGSVINNLDKISTFTPGVGYGNVFYLNVLIGFGFRIF